MICHANLVEGHEFLPIRLTDTMDMLSNYTFKGLQNFTDFLLDYRDPRFIASFGRAFS